VAGIEPATLAWKARALPLCNTRDCPWAGRDSNPRTACRTDLQSVAFNRSATYPRGPKLVTGRDPGVLLPSNGADDRIRTDDLDFTKVLLYQLSYVGDGPRTLDATARHPVRIRLGVRGASSLPSEHRCPDELDLD